MKPGGAVTEQRWSCVSHTHSHRARVHLYTLTGSFFPLKYTLLNTITHTQPALALNHSHFPARCRQKGRKRGMISPQEIFLSSFLVFISQPSMSLFLFHRHTHTCSHRLPSSSSSFSLKNKKYCCTCREAALSVFSLFFLFTPLVQRAVNCDRCWKDVSTGVRERAKEIETGGWKRRQRREGGCWDGGPYGGQREWWHACFFVPKQT